MRHYFFKAYGANFGDELGVEIVQRLSENIFPPP